MSHTMGCLDLHVCRLPHETFVTSAGIVITAIAKATVDYSWGKETTSNNSRTR